MGGDQSGEWWNCEALIGSLKHAVGWMQATSTNTCTLEQAFSKGTCTSRCDYNLFFNSSPRKQPDFIIPSPRPPATLCSLPYREQAAPNWPTLARLRITSFQATLTRQPSISLAHSLYHILPVNYPWPWITLTSPHQRYSFIYSGILPYLTIDDRCEADKGNQQQKRSGLQPLKPMAQTKSTISCHSAMNPASNSYTHAGCPGLTTEVGASLWLSTLDDRLGG